MAFLTKVITDTSPDFGDNPQTVTENDRPASVEVDGLVANTGYWTKAEIWQNGVLRMTRYRMIPLLLSIISMTLSIYTQIP